MAAVVHCGGGFLHLIGGGIDERRPLGEADVARLDELAARYRRLRAGDEGGGGLLALGRDLYRWLDGEASWLRRLRAEVVPPFVLELRAPWQPGPAAWAVLQAPWEVLADEAGFLAADALLGFSPVRRLGTPADPPPLSDHRLGLTFMAAEPRGQVELDYEAEEDAILRAAGQLGIDLVVEDSGDPERLAERLATLEAMPALHLSCHGHNTPRPVLLLEDEEGHPRPTEAPELVGALGARRPQLLFLSACLTAAAGEKDTAGGVAHSLASRLIGAGLPAVLGWDGSVRDGEAILFAHHLYQTLARRQPLAQAVGVSRGKLLGGERPRDWHLARLWLGPQGGGPLVRGQRRRLLVSPEHGHKEFLDRRGQRSPVASREAFVGRRRELQEALRVLRGHDHAGVLLHGMGRLGKSSLAARIAHRFPDLALAVVFEHYDALSVVEALAEGLKDVKPAREMLAEARGRVGNDPGALEGVLLDLLGGPCAQAGGGSRPVLLVIDDLERILEPGAGGLHRMHPDFVPVLRAVLRAFDPGRSDSRLLLTSRFRFILPDGPGGRDLADRLHDLQLPPMSEAARRKLTLRQQQEAIAQPAAERLADAELAARRPLLERAGEVARGNPGLQDLLARLVLAPQATREEGEAALAEMEAYIARGDRPGDAQLNAFLENLLLDKLVGLAGAEARELLRLALLFEHPVPGEALAALGGDGAAGQGQLLALGLLDRFEDVVDPSRPAYAVNELARPRAGALMEFERRELAARALPPLFAAWGGTDGKKRTTYPPDMELTRLALQCGNAEVAAACAANAVAGLAQLDYRRAAEAGSQAIALLDAHVKPVPLALLRLTAEASAVLGELEMADACYARATDCTAVLRATCAAVDPIEEMGLTMVQARLLVAKGERDEALPLLQYACDVAKAHGEVLNVVSILGEIGALLYDKGELDQALALHRQRLGLLEAIAAPRIRTIILGDIAHVLAAKGELDEAEVLFEDARSALHAIGDRRGTAVALGGAARVLAIKGRLDEALALHRDELAVYETLGAHRDQAVTLGDIARWLSEKGDDEQALETHRKRLAILELLKARCDQARTLNDMARLLAKQGESERALALHREALALFDELGLQRERVEPLRGIAHILADSGEVDQAMELLEEVLELVVQSDDVDGKANALWDIAQVQLRCGAIEQAVPKLAEAYSLFARIGRIDGICGVGSVFGRFLVMNAIRMHEEGLAMLHRAEEGYRELGRYAEADQVQKLIQQIESGGGEG